MRGAQHMALTPAHCGHRTGTRPLSRKADIFWKHLCYFTGLALFCTCAVTTRAFQRVLEWLLPLLHTGRLGVRCCQGPCSAQHGGAGPGPPPKDRLIRHTDILDHQSCSSKSTWISKGQLRRKMYLMGRIRMEDLAK